MEPIRAAVIGAGFIGPAHVEALRRIAGVKVAAIASKPRGAAEDVAARFSIPHVYGEWEDVIQDPGIQVVHNCTPNHLHYAINKAAVEAGKHIISEKPLTIDSGESGELVELAEERGVVNAVCYNYRYYPLTQQARSMVERGEVGQIYHVHGHYLQDWLYYDIDYNWRLESKLSGRSRAVADIGSHWCDLIQFITGTKIAAVMADLGTIHGVRKKPKVELDTFKGKEAEQPVDYDEVPIDTEDIGSVLFRMEDGTRGVFHVSQVSAGRKNRLWFEIDGSKCALAWDQEQPNELWVGRRERPNETVIKDPSLLDVEVRKYAHYPGGHPEGYPDGPKNMFINVYEFIRAGKDPRTEAMDFSTFKDGHFENLIVDAVLESYRRQGWVDVRS